MLFALKAADMRFSLLWLLGITTGLRVSDLLALRTSSVSRTGFISLNEKKTGKLKEIQLCPEVLEEYKYFVRMRGLKPNQYLFYSSNHRRDKPMTRQWVHHVIARTARLIGLDFIGAHSMRKIYACNLYRVTGSLKCVQDALNHKYASTTMIYLRDLLEAAVNPS